MTALKNPTQYSIVRSLKHTFPLKTYQRIAAFFIAFILTFCNGRPFTLSSGLYCLAASSLLLFLTFIHQEKISIPKEQRKTMFFLLGWILSATISLFTNFSAEVLWNTCWTLYVPLLMYFAFVSVQLSERDISRIVFFLALGSILRLGYGAWIFYQDHGLLSFNELLNARLDIDAMETYRQATFGNTSNTASLLVILFPVFITGLFALKFNFKERVILSLAILILLFNVLITSSRAVIFFVILLPPIILFMLQSRWKYLLLIILLVTAVLFFKYADEEVLARQLFISQLVDSSSNSTGDVDHNSLKADLSSVAARGTTITNLAYDMISERDQSIFYGLDELIKNPLAITKDNSVNERAKSILFGINLLKKYPLGIGCGMSYINNPFTIAHQFLVAQGDELGWLAILFILMLFVNVFNTMYRDISQRNYGVFQSMIFNVSLFVWILYALFVNIPTGSGPTIPWIGLFVFFLSLSNRHVIYRRSNDPMVCSSLTDVDLKVI